MRSSRFNTIVPDGNGGFLAFNNLSGALLAIRPEVAEYLRGTVSSIPLSDLRRLLKAGFLTNLREAEFASVVNRLREMRYAVTGHRYTILLTYGCNLRCAYCYEQSITQRSHMSMETAELFVEHAWRRLLSERCSRLGLTLYGGEPLLNISAGAVIATELKRRCESKGFQFTCSLITNGTLVPEGRLEPLSGCISLAQLTLDGSPSAHDSVRITHQGRGTFNRVLDAADCLLRDGISVVFRIQVTPENVSTLDQCLQVLKRRGFLHNPKVRLYFFPILDIRGVCSSRSFGCDARFHDPKLLSQLAEVTSRFRLGFLDTPLPVWFNPYCSFVNRGAFIVDPLGQFYKCVSQVGEDSAIIGSLRGTNDPLLAAQWADRERRFVARSGEKIAKCRDCEYLPTCDGGCAYLSILREGDANAPSCETHAYITQASLLFKSRQRTAAMGAH